MKRIGGFLLIIGMLALFQLQAFALTTDEITAESAVLIDADTGQILFDKNMNAKRHPASITKVMTGLLVMEHSDPKEIAIVSEDAVDIPYGTSYVALTPGEELPVDSLMYALMLPSANDAANVLAEHVAGTQADFAKRMTERAAELGAVDTNFSNPHGLDEPFHLTTAHDMALITREAIGNENFLRYFGTGRHTIPATNMQAKERPFTNQQFMLLPDQGWAYNEDVIGGKVGFTDEAKHTMSTAASRSGRTLIAVVMGCGADQKFFDTQALLDYGFDELVAVEVPANMLAELPATIITQDGESVGEITYEGEAPASVLLPRGMGAEDIRCEYLIPESIDEGREAEASVQLTLQGSTGRGVPSLLMEIPLEGLVWSGARSGGQLPDMDGKAGQSGGWGLDGGTILSAVKWPVIAVGGAFVLLVAVRKVQIAKRRSKRMRRMERVLRQREKV